MTLVVENIIFDLKFLLIHSKKQCSDFILHLHEKYQVILDSLKIFLSNKYIFHIFFISN